MQKRVAVIPGDGIGREVVPTAVRVLSSLAHDIRFEWHDQLNADRFLATGEGIDQATWESVTSADAILLGAIGDPRIVDTTYQDGILRRLRNDLDLYANVRPARLLHPLLSPLSRPSLETDLIVVRENTEGLYSQLGCRFQPGTPKEVALQEHWNTFSGVSRVIEYAFAIARREVCLVDKAVAMPTAGALWRRCFDEIAERHPHIGTRRLMVDAAAALLIRAPGSFDVIVTENCFGDILSDVAAEVTGGIGLAPSGSYNPTVGIALFEPVHGSAPDIAGRGIANPIGAIRSGVMLLSFLGRTDEAARLEAAVAMSIAERDCTVDLGGDLSTSEVGDAIMAILTR